MNQTELFIYALANLYHTASLFFSSTMPIASAAYEHISQNLFAMLWAAGAPV